MIDGYNEKFIAFQENEVIDSDSDLNNLMNSLINEDKMIKTISKGYQLTIPADLRNELGMTIGSKVDIEKKNNNYSLKITNHTLKIPTGLKGNIGQINQKKFDEVLNLKL